MEISVITKNNDFFDVLTQHEVLSGGVKFIVYPDISSYENAKVKSKVAVVGADVRGKISGDVAVVYIGKDFPAPYRLQNLFDILQKSLDSDKEMVIGSYRFNRSRKILCYEKMQVDLTEKEADIIGALFEVYPSGLDKKELLDNIWGYSEEIDSHTLETHIYRLRKKIESLNGEIVTDSGGYKIFLN